MQLKLVCLGNRMTGNVFPYLLCFNHFNLLCLGYIFALGVHGWLIARDQNRILEESQIPAKGFSCPERIILSAQVFISATDTSTVSVLTELGQPEEPACFPKCFFHLRLPHGQLQGQAKPFE